MQGPHGSPTDPDRPSLSGESIFDQIGRQLGFLVRMHTISTTR
jgi:hypothetical protein